MKETGPLRLDFRQLKIYPIKLKQIMQVGTPPEFRECCSLWPT